jgi:hypothetical protein
LNFEEWIIVYEAPRQYELAENIYNTMVKASERLRIKIEEPKWIEIPQEGRTDVLD